MRVRGSRAETGVLSGRVHLWWLMVVPCCATVHPFLRQGRRKLYLAILS